MDWKYVLTSDELFEDMEELFTNIFTNKIYYPQELVEILEVFGVKTTVDKLMDTKQFVSADDGSYIFDITFDFWERWDISFKYYILIDHRIEVIEYNYGR